MTNKLTIDIIHQKCKTDNLQKIKKLDVFSHNLQEVMLIKEMPNLEVCSLSLNQIQSLSYFSESKNLRELYLRKNDISDLFEICHLQSCPSLKVLWLWDNPIAQHPLYRQFIIWSLPNIVKLDNSPISLEERQECQKRGFTDQDIIKGAQEAQLKANPQIQSQASAAGGNSINTAQSQSNQKIERPRSLNNRRVHSSNSQQNKNIPNTQQPNLYGGQSQHGSSQQQSNRNNSGLGIGSERGTPLPNQHNTSQSNNQNVSLQNQNSVNGNNNYRNENILCAVLALLKELDESGLELVKRDIDRKLQGKKTGK